MQSEQTPPYPRFKIFQFLTKQLLVIFHRSELRQRAMVFPQNDEKCRFLSFFFFLNHPSTPRIILGFCR